MSFDRKVIGHKTRTISQPIYGGELLKNLTIEICYEASSFNPNSNYNQINIRLEGHNQYKLCAYIDGGCSIYFEKRLLFSEFVWKKIKNPLQVRIAKNRMMSHNQGVEQLSIKIRGVQRIILIPWVTNQPSHDMVIGNNFQRLYCQCTQTIHQIIFGTYEF